MTIAFIGLGEVGSTYSKGLAKNGAKVKGYDLKFKEGTGKEAFAACAEAGVELVDGPEQLFADSDVIFAVTSCVQAIETAEMYKSVMKKGQLYLEMNSAIPSVKKDVKKFIGDSCDVVDGATLCSPSQFGVATPIVMSGPRAKDAADILNGYGMKIECLGQDIGQASAFKVIRSIFTKSLESCLIESLHAARKYGIADVIFKSIVDFLAGEPTDETLALMVKTDVVHAKRRGDEIGEIAEMLAAEGLDNNMASAATKKLYWLSSIGLKEKFHGKTAANMYDVLDALLEIQG
ncbi:phosphogluconate dehydrogenase [Synergistales bacterium]|nr:phosphogluconate dehydrogenase [Synergistales bacterium]